MLHLFFPSADYSFPTVYNYVIYLHWYSTRACIVRHPLPQKPGKGACPILLHRSAHGMPFNQIHPSEPPSRLHSPPVDMVYLWREMYAGLEVFISDTHE